ncbi:hypothetical protein [Vagococcus fluvialis]|uniref:hypothetical protein n=1 Tax=Vagococcus fluvialis TaxID=2738 RepID=UPI000B35A851|nr:hypothetical protein [Vagococcus fluvialis]
MKNIKQLLIFFTASILLFGPFITATEVLGAELDIFDTLDNVDQSEWETTTQNIIDYSEYNYNTGEWVLSYSIVEDGIFSEEQYQNAELAEKEWEKLNVLKNESYIPQIQQRAFFVPPLLIAAIKALGAVIGVTAVTEITTHFTQKGLASGCKKFKKYKGIKGFCKAHGY